MLQSDCCYKHSVVNENTEIVIICNKVGKLKVEIEELIKWNYKQRDQLNLVYIHNICVLLVILFLSSSLLPTQC